MAFKNQAWGLLDGFQMNRNIVRFPVVKPVLWKFYGLDLLVILLFVFNMGAHFLTQTFVGMMTDQEQQKQDLQEQAAQVTLLVEQNPLFKVLLASTGLARIYQLIVFPALLFGTYWWARRRYGIQHDSVLNYYVIIIFTAVLMDFLNDFNIVVGTMIARGIGT